MRELRYYLDDLGPFDLRSLDGMELRPAYRWDIVDGPIYAPITGNGSLRPLQIQPRDLHAALEGTADAFDRVVVVDGWGTEHELKLGFGAHADAALVASVHADGWARDLVFLWSVGLQDEQHADMVDIVVALGERWPLLFFPGDFQCVASDRRLVERYVDAWRAEFAG